MPYDDTKTAKTVSMVMIIMLAAKASGLLRDSLILRRFGTHSEAAAAFAFASQIPRDFLDVAFASAISASFIPVFNSYLERRTRTDAINLANNFIAVVSILATAASLAIFLSANAIAAFWLAAESSDTIALAAQLLRYMSITVLLASLAFSLTGIVQSLGQFSIPAAMSLLSNVLIVGYLLLFDIPNVVGLTIVFVIGNISQVIIIIPPLIKRGFRFKFVLRPKDAGMRQIYRLTPMVLIGSWLFPINSLINSNIAARYSRAAMVQLRAANTLYLVIAGVFVLSLTNVIFPRLSRQASMNKTNGDPFAASLISAIRAGIIFLIPMSVGLAILAVPVIRLFFEGDEFDAVSTAYTAHALRFFTFGMLGFGLQAILSRAFFSLMDGKTPMLISLVAIVVNSAIAISVTVWLGVGGPALAASVSINVAALLMLVFMHRRKPILSAALGALFIKSLVAAALMAAAVLLILHLTANAPQLVTLAAATATGALIYFAAAYVLKIPEICLIRTALTERSRRNE